MVSVDSLSCAIRQAIERNSCADERKRGDYSFPKSIGIDRQRISPRLAYRWRENGLGVRAWD
jgi:hypothetical protein